MDFHMSLLVFLPIFHRKILMFPVIFPLNQFIDIGFYHVLPQWVACSDVLMSIGGWVPWTWAGTVWARRSLAMYCRHQVKQKLGILMVYIYNRLYTYIYTYINTYIYIYIYKYTYIYIDHWYPYGCWLSHLPSFELGLCVRMAYWVTGPWWPRFFGDETNRRCSILNRFISFHLQILFFSHFWGYTDMRWLCSICNVHIFGDFFPCHVWCPFDEKPHMSKKSRHSIRGRRVDPWQKRCHRHWLWLWISENSGNWWDLIHSDRYIYIYTYHTITLPYITLQYITYILYIHIHISQLDEWYMVSWVHGNDDRILCLCDIHKVRDMNS